MTIRTILVGASGGSASRGAIDLACRLGQRFRAHVEGFHVRFDPNEIIIAASSSGLGLPMDGGWLDQMAEEAKTLANATKATFLEAAARHGLTQAATPPQQAGTVAWRDQIGRPAGLIAARARFFDLVVLGRSDRVIDQPASDAIETTLLEAARPVLLAPADPPATIGESIAIGWDGSPQSVRVITASLPLLRQAKQATIIAISEADDPDDAAMAAYLRWHDIAAAHQKLRPIPGVGRGEQLLSAAREAGADLLVMGGYGHAPWRETLFGGATRTVVGTSLLPVLMAH